jgi:hypothetical protein
MKNFSLFELARMPRHSLNKRRLCLFVAAFALLMLLACEDEAPMQMPLPPATMEAEGAANTETSEPAAATAAAATAAKPAAAKPAPSVPNVSDIGDAVQQKTGAYVIQIGVFANKAVAKNVVKKMANNGIDAYIAVVDDPDPEKNMIGTYYRVRIGYFSGLSVAKKFAAARLKPIGYDDDGWWVDLSRKDNVGKLAFQMPKENQVAQEKPKLSEEEAKRQAAIEAAKEEYKAIAKAATAAQAASAP